MKGRPRKPKDEVKDFMLRVRMTLEERSILEAAAKVKSRPLSSWAREELLALARVLLGGEQK
jgi:hypothetical protein